MPQIFDQQRKFDTEKIPHYFLNDMQLIVGNIKHVFKVVSINLIVLYTRRNNSLNN